MVRIYYYHYGNDDTSEPTKPGGQQHTPTPGVVVMGLSVILWTRGSRDYKSDEESNKRVGGTGGGQRAQALTTIRRFSYGISCVMV